MPSAFEERINKIEKEISKFSQLSDSIKDKPYASPHLKKYAQLIDYCQKMLKKNLKTHLRALLDPLETEDEKDEKLVDFRSRIKRLFDVFYGFLATSQKVPRELYYLSDIFLGSKEQTTDYIISVSEEIAMLPFSHVVLHLGLKAKYPEFWNEVKDKKFYFVQILPELADKRASLNWPIIIHEMAHIVCFQRRYDDRYFPSISVFLALKVIEALDKNELRPDEPIVELATEKLYATEILADLLVARYFGVIFGWCFLKEYVDLQDLFEPDRTHPYPDVRVQRVANEAKDHLGMPQTAQLLERELESYKKKVWRRVSIRGFGSNFDSVLADVDKELTALFVEIRKDKRSAFTFDGIRQGIRESAWFNTQGVKAKVESEKKLNGKNLEVFLEQLHKDMIVGKPIVVDPPVAYFLTTLGFSEKEMPNPNTKQGRYVLELVADLVRLYAVQKRVFKSRSRSSPQRV